MERSEVFALQARVARLERRARALIVIVGAAIVALTASLVCVRSSGVALAAAGPDGKPEVLRVRGIVVVDEKGTERVVLGAPCPDPRMGGKPQPRISPAVGIQINDSKGDECGGFGVLDNGRVVLGMDRNGEEGVMLFVLPEGLAGLRVSDKKGVSRIQLAVSEDGKARLETWDSAGAPTFDSTQTSPR